MKKKTTLITLLYSGYQLHFLFTLPKKRIFCVLPDKVHSSFVQSQIFFTKFEFLETYYQKCFHHSVNQL